MLPVSAQTIHTDDTGLDVSAVGVRGADNVLVPAYRAQPKGNTHLPVIIVVHETFGVHEHIADACRRFAKLGYMVIAPDLFIRQGDASAYKSMHSSQRAARLESAGFAGAFRYRSDRQVGGRTRRQSEARGFRRVLLGRAYFVAVRRHNSTLKAAVAFYERAVGNKTENTPNNPLDIVSQLKVPVFGLYERQDTLEQMKQALANDPPPAKNSQFVVYDDAGHAFFADYRPNYRKADAEDAWKRALAWFREHSVK